MAKFNVTDNRKTKGTSPIQTGTKADLRTGNNAPGFSRDAKSELFLLAAGSFFGQDKFYETSDASTARFVKLVQGITATDPAWMLSFITWLRGPGNIRTGAVVASVEAALACKDRNGPIAPGDKGIARLLAQAGIGRLDEVGEAYAYYLSTRNKKVLPKPLKRGLADALTKLANEYSVAKYDSAARGWRLADLVRMLHPTPSAFWQSDLFKYVVKSADDPSTEIPESLGKLARRKSIMEIPVQDRRLMINSASAPVLLRDGGMTWEALAGWLQGPMDKQAWEAIIPSMGYMALIRNLRNFDQAGVSDQVANGVMNKIMAEHEVAKSKQFPFRFLTAYRNAPNLRWHYPLAVALDHSLANVPKLVGKTLILVDTSGSMADRMSEHGDVQRWDIAALFGIALAMAGNDVDLYAYSGGGRELTKRFVPAKGAKVLSEADRWKREGYNMGGGTPTGLAIQRTYDPHKHNRVVILTDEQTDGSAWGVGYGWAYGVTGRVDHSKGVGQLILDRCPLYTFNLAGYRAGHTAGTMYRHTLGGLNDQAFKYIPMIEAGIAGKWPWEIDAATVL